MACTHGAPIRWPRQLRWVEVDPALHPFDPTGLAELVRPLVPPGPRVAGEHPPDDWMDVVSRALCARLGDWATAWRWGVGEGGGGGPVTAWCCASHSLGTPDETAARIAAAVADWRAWLEELDATFRRLAPPPGADHAATLAAFERAAASLVDLVARRTGCEDAWYTHCAQVLGWSLERLGVAEPAPLVEAAIGGRFRSWLGPNDDLRDDVAAGFARGAAEATRPGE